MKTHHEPPESGGTKSPGHMPQVVVRAGKTFLCSSCGTLVEVPPEVVGQLVIAVNRAPQEEQVDEPHAAQERSTKPAPSRPKRPIKPKRESFVGQTIDGLQVPSAQQLDRALKWVSFHLRVLDRQGSEIQRLRKLLKTPPAPRPSPLGPEHEVLLQPSDELESNKHAHENVSMASLDAAQKAAQAKERGPP